MQPPTASQPDLGGRKSFSLAELKQLWKTKLGLTQEDKKGFGTQKQIESIVNGKNKVLYLSNNLSLYVKDLLHDIRNKFDGLILASRELTDLYRASLILLGGATTKTGLHLDWTEAYNIAFAIGTSSLSDPLAVWTFLHPSLAEQANAWLIQNGFEKGFQTAGRAFLSDDRVSAFKTAMDALMPGGSGGVLVVEQRAGDMVYVPPGWIHQVYNLQPCLKLAWDFYATEHFAIYSMLQSRIAAPLFGAEMADDYMGSNWVLGKML